MNRDGNEPNQLVSRKSRLGFGSNFFKTGFFLPKLSRAEQKLGQKIKARPELSARALPIQTGQAEPTRSPPFFPFPLKGSW